MSDSGSESDLSQAPSQLHQDDAIEETLHKALRDAIAREEEITVNSIRARVEAQLGLDSGFLRSDSSWKQKSKDIITAAFEESPKKTKSQTTSSRPAAKPARKRKSEDERPQDAKKRKVSRVKESRLSSGTQSLEGSDAKVQDPSDPDTTNDRSDSITENARHASTAARPDENHIIEADDSDLSSVINDAPLKKRRNKKSSSPGASKPKPRRSSTTKTTKVKPGGKDLTADEEEIKRLQGWLVKCGVRKLWHRELANCASTKEKLKHLRKMLEGVGMTGRYSIEKARQIKEARELAAELGATKEFNEQWGHGSGDEEVGDGNGDGDGVDGTKGGKRPEPSRKLKPKGLIDFGDSDEDDDSG